MLVNAHAMSQDIEGTMLRHRRVHAIEITHIEMKRRRTRLRRDACCRFDLQISAHDMKAIGGEPTHDRLTDAAGTARNQGAS
jgi:hypothetical protein